MREIPDDAAQKIAKSKRGGGANGPLEKYDRRFEEGEKKHRNILSSFNHWYFVITHPFFIFAVFCVLFLIFIAAKYTGLLLENDALVQIGEDAKTALTYLATAIVTAVFTKFVDKK
jgi:hypothetical protein